MKILIIGGNGFIGSKVSYALSRKGHEVTIFDIKKNKTKNSKSNLFLETLEIYNLCRKQLMAKK